MKIRIPSLFVKAGYDIARLTSLLVADINLLRAYQNSGGNLNTSLFTGRSASLSDVWIGP